MAKIIVPSEKDAADVRHLLGVAANGLSHNRANAQALRLLGESIEIREEAPPPNAHPGIRLCVANGKKAIFHGWASSANISVAPSNGGGGGMAGANVYAIVEYEDGAAAEVPSWGITFADRLFLGLDFWKDVE